MRTGPRRLKPPAGLRPIAGLIVAAVVAAGCGDDDTSSPEVGTGGGLRIHLPAEARDLPWMRVEVWNDDAVDPPDCPGKPMPGAAPAFVSAPAQTDSCTKSEIFIWDYLGRIVRHEPEVPYPGRAWGWDTENNDGVPVPSGYYFTRQACLDSKNEFTFTGHYYLRRDRERNEDACDWPLWIDELSPGPSQPTLAYPGFPLVASTVLLDAAGKPISQIVFDNPFLVRIQAPGYETFEREIRFTEYEYTDVDVVLTPVTSKGR